MAGSQSAKVAKSFLCFGAAALVTLLLSGCASTESVRTVTEESTVSVTVTKETAPEMSSEATAEDSASQSDSPDPSPGPESDQSTPEPTSDIPGFGDGIYIIGEDIKPGTYRSDGSDSCYWERLAGFSGELDDIIANGNNAPEIVTVSKRDAAFSTNGCGSWRPVEETAPNRPSSKFGDGTYQVGVHIQPGTYRASGTESCYWARLSDFAQTLDGIISNGNDPTVVEIAESDAGFTTTGCGTWRKR